MLNKVSRISLLGAALALAGTQGAFALDADDFGAKFKAVTKLMGLSASFGAASVNGDTVVLSNFVMTVPGEDPVELPGDLTFTGVAETGDGGYTAEVASIEDIVFESEEDGEQRAFSFENIRVENLRIPARATIADAVDISFSLYERVSAGPLLVTIDGADVFNIDLIEANISSNDARNVLTSTFSVTGMRGDVSTMPDPEALAFFETLGITQFTSEIRGEGIWYLDEGRMDLTEMSFGIDNLASLNMTAVLGGYTRQFYTDMLKTSIKMAEMAEAGEDISGADMAAMEEGLLAQFANLTIERAAVRYDDNSLFYKLLDLAGAEQGIDGQTFASGLKFMVPMMLTEIENPQFTAMVSAAVNAFIDNPVNFEIAAEPAEPVGADAFMALEDDPLALIDLLNVQVRANQ